jgi:hypothetical protein
MKTDYFETRENPFLIDIEDKDEYDWNDYLNIQRQLEEKSATLDAFLETLYPDQPMRTPLEEMKRRTKKGVTQKIIDVSFETLPKYQLFQLGNGGQNCIVCCTPVLNNRCDASQTILQSLQEVDFHGHFLLLNGGYPNPTGKEMKYVGVPYSFKIFMMLEAKKRGFEKVIWIDAACYAINNLQPLFDKLESSDAIFTPYPPNYFASDTCNNIVFPKTIELLNSLVNRDIRNDATINSIVFGLNFSSPIVNEFVEEYYSMVKLGLPFLSCFPEEIVFTAILNQPKYHHMFSNPSLNGTLYIHNYHVSKEYAKKYGYYFSQRQYNS